MGSILQLLPCPQSAWLAWMGVPLEMLQAIFLHPYFQLNYPRSTKFYRAAVIPICVYLAFATVIRRTITPLDQYLHFNFGFTTMPTFHFVCLSIIFGLHQGPVFKSEVELFNRQKLAQQPINPETTKDSNAKIEGSQFNSSGEKNVDNNYVDHRGKNKNNIRNRKPNCNRDSNSVNYHRIDSADKSKYPSSNSTAKLNQSVEAHVNTRKTRMDLEKSPSIGELTRWVGALVMSPRGIACTWSPPESVVPLEKFSSYQSFMFTLIFRTLVMHIWFQFVCGVGVEIIQNSKGDVNHFLFETLQLPQLRILKLLSPFYLTIVLGGGAYSGFALAGGLFNIVEITTIEILRKILPDDSEFKPEPVNTSNYPPLFNSPWVRTSLTEFWGKGWQAVFRHHFLFCGAQPMWLIFSKFNPTIGKLAAVMGAMSLSAAMHEFCLVAVSRFDPAFSSSRMFLSQGVGIVLEAIFKKVTGRKVSGFWGWLWGLCFIILNGKSMVDAWVQRDLGKGVVPLREWSWIHYLVPFGALITDDVYAYLSSWLKFF